MGGFVSSVISKVVSVVTGANPLVSLGVSLFLSWALRPKTPEIPDFASIIIFEFGHILLTSHKKT